MISFSPAAEKKFQEIVARYPRKDAAMLPVLWLAQEEFEFISPEVGKYVAEKLEVSVARVESVIGFYTLYNTKKMGKYHLQVCRNISCYLKGCKDVMDAIETELHIKPGETTPDGKFTYSHVECLAACGNAPAMQVNMDYHENLNAESVTQLVVGLKGNL